MRNRRLPIGWPRRDPRHYRFPLPNVVWEYKLKPIEFVTLSYLCCRHSHGNTSLSPEMIAKGVHLTLDTVKKYLVSLVGRELITNEYTPIFQCDDSKKFFTLPNEIFLLNLPPSAFMVYAYLLLIEDRRTHTCHPSYNTIAAETGMTKNTTMKNISNLLDAGLITMEHSSYFDKRGMKWKGNNLYTILPAQIAVDQFHQRQLDQLGLDAARRRVRKRQDEYDRRHPRTALCTPAVPDPAPAA
ncbi:MAG: helix-turn-helix domain-containing protein [Oscillospiraceae bacterium]|nr:helix-turn-helix domain-containing protein [Oscillospiraceae bacterium]MDE7172399.1 helix-turn-helix domain-containing protein [Oscillospiraceae bacterium]